MAMNMKRKFLKRTWIFLIVLTMIVSIWLVRHEKSSHPVSPPAVAVRVMTIKESNVPLDIQAIGTLSAQTVEMTPELAGHVNKILIPDGGQVKKGQVIIHLDDAMYQAKLASSEAQLVYSKNNYKRMVLLGKQGAVTKQAIDSADADLKQRRAESLENSVMVQKMRLSAPFDGVIGKVKVEPGDYVNVGEHLVTLTDINHLHIEYTVPEIYLPQLKVGQSVDIQTNIYPDKKFTGKVAFVSPTIDPVTRSVQVYAEISNNDRLLSSGMFVTAHQSIGEQSHALMVPARSAISTLNGQQVYKVIDGKAVPVSVILGVRRQDMVEVKEGLSVGDVIVTDGQIKLQNGSPVKIET